MDEIDAIGGRRFSEGTSADREIQRTLMELLAQLDGFDSIGKVKMIMATNRCGRGPYAGGRRTHWQIIEIAALKPFTGRN